MNDTQIFSMLHKLEVAFRPQSPERLSLYRDVIVKKQITAEQLGDAIITAIERCDYFPSMSDLIKFARPEAVNMPRRDGEPAHEDPITTLEREIATQNAWLREFTRKGDEYGQRMARLAIERASRKVNDRLEARGMPTRHVAPGVEVFGEERSGHTYPTRASFGDWTQETDD